MPLKYRFVPKKTTSYSSRKSVAHPIKDAIQSLLKSYHIDKKYNYTTIINSWEQLMGKTIASRTGRIFVKEGKLFVEIYSAPLKNDMKLSKAKIIDILNKHVGEVIIKDIIFL
ncbi:DUF721 domain-containing protein [Chondrinema litorale]|uniref:DUF721 domain-containing protein n=1 Tax=Chondrinema litorale TaxID=2994555 RepID=UPI002542E445|nr:DUF721 domain-containing protein [Chondrinema litorale]UZR92264.1 DUF721 domain-containing protein [Chondrinema litorale]